MASDAGSVTEEAKVTIADQGPELDQGPDQVSNQALAQAPTPSTEPEGEPEEELEGLFAALINPWSIAENRLGRSVRSVTVHTHDDYRTLHAFPSEGPDTHVEYMLGRI